MTRAPEDYFQTWCELDYPGDWRRRLIVQLTTYLDVGITDDNPATGALGVMAMGGYLAEAKDWISFGRRWRRALRDNDIKIFRMSEYETGHINGVPPYASWDRRHRIAFFSRLVRILGDSGVMLGVGEAIVRRDYEALTDEERGRFGNPYRHCAASCMRHVRLWLDDMGIPDPVDYVFELGDEGQGLFRAVFDEMMSHRKFRDTFRIRSIDFKAKEDATGLQTGDIAAFETCKHVPRVMGVETRAIRGSMAALLARVPHRGRFLTIDELREVIAHRDASPPFREWIRG